MDNLLLCLSKYFYQLLNPLNLRRRVFPIFDLHVMYLSLIMYFANALSAWNAFVNVLCITTLRAALYENLKSFSSRI